MINSAHDHLQPANITDVPGWEKQDHDLSLQAFKLSAEEILSGGHGFSRSTLLGGLREQWLSNCTAALEATNARQFFETEFAAFRVTDFERPQGLFTGYYEPLAEGSLVETSEFRFPIYKRPSDLVAVDRITADTTGFHYGKRNTGGFEPYATRREIEAGALKGRGLELCWLKSAVDGFFIHVQGQGRVVLAQGGEMRLAFAAKNGRPYSGIGAVLLNRGIGTPETMSMGFLRQWMAQHPAEAQDLMLQNDSYIFFREVNVTDAALGSIGAAKVNLTPECSLAVDRQFWMFGTPLWIETTSPVEATGTATPYRRLMIAQDTGTAIKGIIRGDVYWGWGNKAIAHAGHMKSPGAMTALLPKPVAEGLGLL